MSKHQSLNYHCRQTARTIVVAALLTGLAAAPASSLESAWAETEGGRMRLVVDPEPRADGTMLGVLDIDLETGWKTYWRDPGSAGIPPMLDFSQSDGVVLEDFRYPPPVRVDDGYAVWAGYIAPVRFPLVLRRTVSGKVEIRAQAFIGICEKICIPFQADLTLDLPHDALASAATKTMVDEAMARLPEPAGPDFNVDATLAGANSRQMQITANLPGFRPAGARPELFVAGPPGFAFAQPELIADKNGTAQWQVRIESLPSDTDRIDLSLIDAVITFGQRAIGTNLGDATTGSN